MAEQIPYGVAVSLINKLASLSFRELGRIYGVMDELEKLKTTLEIIQAKLCDAEERQEQEHSVKIWISRLKQVLYHADDLFDELLIHDLQQKVNSHGKVSDFFSSSNPVVFRHKVATRIDKIRQELDHVSKDMSLLNLNQTILVSKENESDWRETSSFVLPSEIVGRGENKNEIIDLLKQTHTNQNISLIAIVGIGGLGKTALAQLVYNDANKQNLFQKYMWVCISEEFEVKTILTKMLKSLKSEEVGNLELEQLQKKLQGELNCQKYMLVLDDVWNENPLKWDDLKNYLMCGGHGSKILVTTRSTIVSQTMGINTPYVLKGLSKEQSWTLLKKVTFGEDANKMSSSLQLIGERIAEKCGGVPLAIRTIGGFLRTLKEESDQWSSILNDDIWRLCEERESIMPVLKLSYQKLPLGLRQCFAYCCLYPKDWEIKKDELIQLWMAQGYLENSNERQSMEDVGNQNVKILLMRSFLQDAYIDEYNNVRHFKVHDLMHDLAVSIAGKDCCLASEGQGLVGSPMHVSFVSRTLCSLKSIDASRLRTILWPKQLLFVPKPEVGFVSRPSIIKKLKHLRVLDLSWSSISKLSESIGNIKHLRYLDLSYCDELSSLPIGNLVSLQTLKLNGCRKLVFRVELITKLIGLRHLEIRYCKAFEDMMPAGLGDLSSLQYLSDFVIGNTKKIKRGKLNELKDLNNIRGDLRISNLNLIKDVALESQEVNMKAKKYIQSLLLDWVPQIYDKEEIQKKSSDDLQILDNLSPHQNLRWLSVTGYPGERFSSWLPSLTNIIHISLSNFSNCKSLPPLERLPWLKILEIRSMRELKYIHYEEISDVFFSSLETLILQNCKNLRGWQRQRDDANNHLSLPHFPRLSFLEIVECPNLTCMPTFPHLFDQLELYSCSVKPLINTCIVHLDSSSFCPLSALKKLSIGGKIDIEAMHEEWMQNLKSLECLSLWGSSMISSLLQHLQHLPTQIQELRIQKVDDYKLDLWKDKDDVSTQCQAPLHCLGSVKKISISVCENLKALPEKIGDLQSLRHMEIIGCPKLESLPEGMHYLTNLQALRIILCPLLCDRYQIETGQDWPKIAHIHTSV